MPTNTPGSTARQLQDQQITYLRLPVTIADNGVARTVGVLPAGALILRSMSGVHVGVAFNAGTTNTIDIGVPGTANRYGSALALGTLGAFNPTAQGVDYRVTADTTITATVTLAGTAATAGQADVVIAYVI